MFYYQCSKFPHKKFATKQEVIEATLLYCKQAYQRMGMKYPKKDQVYFRRAVYVSNQFYTRIEPYTKDNYIPCISLELCWRYYENVNGWGKDTKIPEEIDKECCTVKFWET